MNVSRESIFTALLTLGNTAVLSGNAPAFLTASRKFRSWDEVSEAEMPALFIIKGNENASQIQQYGDTRWRLKALAFIYCVHSPASDSVPDTNVNALLDAFEASLKPGPNGRQTLGGLITHCYIDGEVLVSEGSMPNDTKSVALIPITIETGI